MILLLAGLGVLLVSGVVALKWDRVGPAGAMVGPLLGLAPALNVLARGEPEALRLPWQVPYGSFFVEIDVLSAFFLLPILGLSALAALYGSEYMESYRGKRALGPPWFFYNALVAGMALAVVARNAVLFLAAWETMSLASYFLVVFEDDRAEAREAGWTYLVATHLGTAFLLAMFVVLGRGGSMDFDRFGAGAPASLVFVLALVGFGTKAGFMPMHVWLPEAHPAAPSHVSAVMSGVMIKTGIYGLVRVLQIVGGHPPLWWGGVLVAIGVTSGVLGVLFALAQHDLKRLLAYHSVENIGIIALGLGLGLVGLSCGSRPLVALGFAGGLLHVVNHAVFKGLLFLGAGAVAHGTGTREMDHLGGLAKRMPVTGGAFLVGAAAISGLPPLNGFVSEFLILLGGFQGVVTTGPGAAVPALAAVTGLALIGGLAAACFAKAFGIVFLGEPRSDHAAHAHDVGLRMKVSMVVLSAMCLGIGLVGPWAVDATSPVVERMAGGAMVRPLAGPILWKVTAVSTGLLALILALVALRSRLLARRTVGETVTWDCGYAAPTARMQYTSSSFAQPLTSLFAPFLRPRTHAVAPAGHFPRDAEFASEVADVCRERIFRPSFQFVAAALHRLRWLQHGRVHLYVLYIAVTLLVLLVWKLS